MCLILSSKNDGLFDVENINKFLEEVDCDFKPKISERVSLVDYSKKIYEFAEVDCFIEASNNIVALIAFYLNNDSSIGYITMLAVDQAHRGMGLGAKLLKNSIAKCFYFNIEKLVLEVADSNLAALRLYYKNGFFQSDSMPKYKGKVYLEKIL